MKWYWYIFIVLILSIGIEEYRISKLNLKVHQLEVKVKELQDVQKPDTIKGVTDTVEVIKIKTIKIQIKKDIDTLILKDNHLFRVQTSGDFLNIDVECRQPEKIITRVDTIKIYQRELVEIPTIEYRLGNSEVFFIGYGLGTAVTIAVVYLVTKLR